MSTWDFNCPRFRGFLDSGESSDSDVEAYFDAVHASPPDTEGPSLYQDASDKSRNAGRQSRPFTRSAAAALASPPLPGESTSDAAKENKKPSEPSREALQKPREKAGSELALHTVKREPVKAKARAPRKALCENRGQRGTKMAAPAPSKGVAQKTLAELVRNFERTPRRFHSRRSPQNAKPGKTATTFKLTVPVTPCLATRLRSRPVRIETKAERDQRLAEELKKYKARPSKVLPARKTAKEEPEAVPGPSKRSVLPPREAVAPIEDRRKTRTVSAPVETERKFIARPPPKAVLAGQTFKPLKRTAKPTVAQSPAFALKERCQSWNLKRKQTEAAKKEEEAVPAKRPSRTRLRHGTAEQQKPAPPRQRSTTPQPFSFQTRQEEALRKKQARLQEEAKKTEELLRFKAKPAPPPQRAFRLRCQSAPLTSPKPFRLASITRHEEQKRNLQEKVKKLDEQLATLSKFVAKPCPVLRPFRAKLERKHTVPDEVKLHSTARAQQRHDFDSALLSRMHKRTAESEERKKAEEEAAIRELRRKTVFRANPVPCTKLPTQTKRAAQKTTRTKNSEAPSSSVQTTKRRPKRTTPGKN